MDILNPWSFNWRLLYPSSLKHFNPIFWEQEQTYVVFLLEIFLRPFYDREKHWSTVGLRTFIAVVPDTLWVGRLCESESFLLNIDHLGLLAYRPGLGEAELQQEVEVVEAAVLLDEVSEVVLRVLHLVVDLTLAEDAENPPGRISWPASVHSDASTWWQWRLVASTKSPLISSSGRNWKFSLDKIRISSQTNRFNNVDKT